MAFGDQLKNWLKKNPQASTLDSSLSLGMPESSVYGASIQPSETAEPARNAPAPQAPAKVDSPADLTDSAPVRLPLMGSRPVGQQQRVLSVLLALALAVLIGITLLGVRQGDQTARQLASTGQVLMHSQRLAKAVQQAMAGDASGFADAADSARVLTQHARGLLGGSTELNLPPLLATEPGLSEQISPLLERVEQDTAALMAQRKALTTLAQTLRQIDAQSDKLLDLAQAVASQKLQQGAPLAEVAAAQQLALLTQRLNKLGQTFLSLQGAGQPALTQLGQDLRSFRQIATGLLDGDAALGLAASADSTTRANLSALLKLFDDTAAPATAQLDNLAGLAGARTAQTRILGDAEVLRQQFGSLQANLSSPTGLNLLLLLALTLAAILAVLSVVGLSYAQRLSARQRQAAAEALQQQAQHQEQEARRVNDATQAAILRLMNELQAVAEGDLTQEATVTEDITGAIADSVNYTVEELRSLVGNVQNTAARVAATTAEVDMTSTELLAASNEQLHEIRETGLSVVDMAARINQVSAQAQASADVARQSLQAATVGLQAVQDAMGGMNTIRDQIQDTAKRIKRLGESSQEIGEITELISDITEQTNVLALNAAIQAASAGDAGRGFSVVAQEVQRLAERSADATRQIAALVKAIQTDTQDAVGAMERSTQGVVEGARLSDNAGTALTEIDQVSRRLAELITQISEATSREANQANEVAENIQHIFAVTEQTGEGTRSTAAQVRELARVAEELRQSVARFRIA